MPFLVQQIFWEKDPLNKYTLNKIVRDIQGVNSLREWARKMYEKDAEKVFESFSSGCHDDIKGICDIDYLEEIIQEVLDEDASENLKYRLIIESIIQSFFCAVYSKELHDWEPDGNVITTFYTD